MYTYRFTHTPPPITVEPYLLGIPFPVNKSELIAYVKGNEAPYAVLKVIERFDDAQYEHSADVIKLFNDLRTERVSYPQAMPITHKKRASR